MTVWELVVFGIVIARVVRYEQALAQERPAQSIRAQIESRRAARG